jgi:hypothetical protein
MGGMEGAIRAVWREANKIYTDAEEKVFDEIPPRWSFAGIEYFP